MNAIVSICVASIIFFTRTFLADTYVLDRFSHEVNLKVPFSKKREYRKGSIIGPNTIISYTNDPSSTSRVIQFTAVLPYSFVSLSEKLVIEGRVAIYRTAEVMKIGADRIITLWDDRDEIENGARAYTYIDLGIANKTLPKSERSKKRYFRIRIDPNEPNIIRVTDERMSHSYVAGMSIAKDRKVMGIAIHNDVHNFTSTFQKVTQQLINATLAEHPEFLKNVVNDLLPHSDSDSDFDYDDDDDSEFDFDSHFYV